MAVDCGSKACSDFLGWPGRELLRQFGPLLASEVGPEIQDSGWVGALKHTVATRSISERSSSSRRSSTELVDVGSASSSRHFATAQSLAERRMLGARSSLLSSPALAMNSPTSLAASAEMLVGVVFCAVRSTLVGSTYVARRGCLTARRMLATVETTDNCAPAGSIFPLPVHVVSLPGRSLPLLSREAEDGVRCPLVLPDSGRDMTGPTTPFRLPRQARRSGAPFLVRDGRISTTTTSYPAMPRIVVMVQARLIHQPKRQQSTRV